MDEPPTSPTEAESTELPRTPYREGVPLADIIPPDRRRLKAAALVVSSMVVGVVLWVLGGWALETIRGEQIPNPPPRPTPPVAYGPNRIGSFELRGPDARITLPPARRSVVNVWLQGCSDCMPAFEAMAAVRKEGAFGSHVPVINVAYGEAEPTWAGRYGVAENLVFDPGGAKMVRPLGIGTFTTLVVEPNGTIIHRDRPDRDGFAARIRSFFPPPPPPADLQDPFSEPVLTNQPLGADAVQRVVAAHTAAIKRTCWERSAQSDTPHSVSVTVSLTIETDGHVSSTKWKGDDPIVAKCIEDQTRQWLFPAPPSPTTVSIPFKFVRQ